MGVLGLPWDRVDADRGVAAGVCPRKLVRPRLLRFPARDVFDVKVVSSSENSSLSVASKPMRDLDMVHGDEQESGQTDESVNNCFVRWNFVRV